MKQSSKATLLAVGVAMASSMAHAVFVPNDLYLGFTKGSASSDYIVDLGSASTVGVGGGSVVDLSSDVSGSTFTSIFGSSPVGVSMGVVGGKAVFPSSYDIYATAFRGNGAFYPPNAGSDLSGFNHSQNTISSGTADVGQMAFNVPAGGSLTDPNKSWTTDIAPTLNANTFYGATGVNPNSAIDSSDVLYEDLWQATPSSAYKYLGFFTLDMSGSNPSLTFTSAMIPEPTTFSLLGGGLLLFLGFRRKFQQAA